MRLRQLLSYDSETGVFTWKINIGKRIRAGSVAGTTHHSGYNCIIIERSHYTAHRLAWLYFYGEWPSGVIDHINGDKFDNRISNLRDVSRSVNQQNRRKAAKNSKTGMLGVSQAGSVFVANIMVDGKTVRLGRYETAELAHAAYVNAKRQHHAGCTI